MQFKRLYWVLGICCSLSGLSLDAMNRRTEVYVPAEDGDEDDYSYYQTDTWFGPGYYYGVWFDNEDNYWGWRHDHRHYPGNRNYYHRERPIPYRSENRGERNFRSEGGGSRAEQGRVQQGQGRIERGGAERGRGEQSRGGGHGGGHR